MHILTFKRGFSSNVSHFTHLEIRGIRKTKVNGKIKSRRSKQPWQHHEHNLHRANKFLACGWRPTVIPPVVQKGIPPNISIIAILYALVKRPMIHHASADSREYLLCRAAKLYLAAGLQSLFKEAEQHTFKIFFLVVWFKKLLGVYAD